MERKYSKDSGDSKERRQGVRYPIVGAVSIQWKASDGKWREVSGMTRDIGKNGVFVECEGPPPVGAHLKLVITLPTQVRDYGSVYLCGVGAVRHLRRGPPPPSGFGARAQFQLNLPVPEASPL